MHSIWKGSFWGLVLLAGCASAPTVKPTPPEVHKTKDVVVEKLLPTKITSHFPDGVISGYVVSRYDSQGFLVKEESFNGNGTLAEYKTTEKNGAATRYFRFNAAGDLQSRQEVTFSPDGRILKEAVSTPNDVVQSTSEYTYGPDGLVKTWTASTPQGSVKTEYTYEGNRLKQILQSDSDGKVIRRFEQSYDGGNLSEKTEKSGTGAVLGKTVYNYKEGKLVKEETFNEKGSSLRRTEYQLDNAGRAVKALYYALNRLIEVKDFEYQVFKKTIQITE